MEALIKFTPDYFIDTMGYSFTYSLFKIFAGSKIACYTHYPTISTDMLSMVSSSTSSFNNRPFIARSPLLTRIKLLYYRLFAMMYGFSGRFSDLIMVNSSWTRSHIQSVWNLSQEKVHLLFPPCDTSAFQALSLTSKEARGTMIISIAQFRPEKNHEMQLIAFRRFIDLTTTCTQDSVGSKLVLVGSCRNQEDEARVYQLKRLAKDLGLENQVRSLFI